MAGGFSLGELGDAAGQSLGSAQEALAGDLPTAPTRMAISETTLELKVAVSGETASGLRVHTIAPEQVRRGAVDPAALSTVTLRFVALGRQPMPADGPASEPGTSAPTRLTPLEAIRRLAEARDVLRLESLLGKLTYSAELVGAGRAYAVIATDARGRIVRETMIPAALEGPHA